MSILARHRYIITRVAEAFNYENEDEVEAMMQPDDIATIDHFFTAEGPTRIIITIEDVLETHRIGNFCYHQNQTPSLF